MATDVLVENDFKEMKKPGLWDLGVATGGPGQKPDKKNDPVCQTAVWPLAG